MADLWPVNNLAQSRHPFVFLGSTVGVEVNRFTICEADPEAFFNVLVALIFFCKSGLTATFRLRRAWIGHQRGLVVHEAGSFHEVDYCPFLVGVLMVGC